jgi:serine/threonine protein kinase
MSRLGPYTLVRKIGADAIAEAWIASNDGGRRVVLKRIAAPSVDFRDTFLADAATVATLVHPNIVPLVDSGADGDQCYLAFGYLPGKTVAGLRDELREDGGPIAVYIAVECCRALRWAHARVDGSGKSLGVVHRAISPDKIHVTYAGDVRVADFGLAKFAHLLPKSAGPVTGEPAYMSPEQVELNALDLDLRTDVFSLGLVLAEMITGERLFIGTRSDILLDVARFRFPEERFAAVPEDLREILRQTLARNREERLQSTAELENALVQFLGAAGVAQARTDLIGLMAGMRPETSISGLVAIPGHEAKVAAAAAAAAAVAAAEAQVAASSAAAAAASAQAGKAGAARARAIWIGALVLWTLLAGIAFTLAGYAMRR